jgi:CRP-like cAMP-binding protein
MAVPQANALLELDPDLGQLLSGERLESARQELRARVISLDVGEWDSTRLADADPAHLGLLVLDGVLAREVVLGDTISTELLGPGDILRPWGIHGPSEFLQLDIRFNVLAGVRAALLDRRFSASLSRYPEVNAVIVDRLAERSLRLAIAQAISQLNRVDRRLLALFWHLAERWGRVARDGIAIPLVLSHRLIGELIGARRPTVSTALTELAREGQLVRREDGTWLLTGEPVAMPQPGVAEVIRQRRRLMPTPPEAVEPEPLPVLVASPPAPGSRFAALQVSLEAARTATEAHRVALGELQTQGKAIRDRTSELRAQRRQRLEELRAAALERREP